MGSDSDSATARGIECAQAPTTRPTRRGPPPAVGVSRAKYDRGRREPWACSVAGVRPLVLHPLSEETVELTSVVSDSDTRFTYERGPEWARTQITHGDFGMRHSFVILLLISCV